MRVGVFYLNESRFNVLLNFLKFNLLYFFLTFFVSITGFAQSLHNKKEDSLLLIIKNAKEDSNKVKSLINLSKYYTAFNKPLAVDYTRQAFSLAMRIKFVKGLFLAQYHQYSIYYYSDQLDSIEPSLLNLEKNLTQLKPDSDQIRYMRLKGLTYRSNVFSKKGNIKMAHDNNVLGVKLSKIYGDKKAEASFCSNLSNDYGDIGETAKELELKLRALKLFESISKTENIDRNLALMYMNLGVFYSQAHQDSLGLFYSRKAYDLFIKLKSYSQAIEAKFDMGQPYKRAGMPDSQMVWGKAFLLLGETKKNPTVIYIAANEISVSYYEKKELNNALFYALKSEQAASQLSYEKKAVASYLLHKIYDLKSNIPLSLKYLKMHYLFNDSVKSKEFRQSIISSDLKSYFKTKEITDSIKNIEEKRIKEIVFNQELKEHRNIIYYSLAGLVLMCILTMISYRAFKLKQKTNILIEEQKRLVEEKQKDILDSIQYARRIQNALLTPEQRINKDLKRLNIS